MKKKYDKHEPNRLFMNKKMLLRSRCKKIHEKMEESILTMLWMA